jgi:hypothetical protein
MAKREINRQVEEAEPATETADTGVANSAVEVQSAPTVEKTKPLDVTVEVKAPGVFVMRVWSGVMLFAGRGRMNKIPIVPGKPIQIRITQ